MADFTRSGSATRSIPSTWPPPSLGSRMPHSILSVVDLPAPFGPRKPYSSPVRTVRSRWSTATILPKRRISPRVTTAAGAAASMLRLRPGSEDRVGRHAGLEGALEVREADLDAEDEVHALLPRLHVLRRELRLGCDLGDLAREGAPRERVHGDRRGLAEPDPADVSLGHVRPHPHVGWIDQGHDRDARVRHLARLEILPQDHAGQRRDDLALPEPALGERQRRPGLGDPRARARYRVRARAGHQELETLLGRLEIGAGRGDLLHPGPRFDQAQLLPGAPLVGDRHLPRLLRAIRSEERRVGKEW